MPQSQVHAGDVTWDFSGKLPPIGGPIVRSTSPIDCMPHRRPATAKSLAKILGVGFTDLLSAIRAADLKPIDSAADGEPLFDPAAASRALISAGHYPIIRGA